MHLNAGIHRGLPSRPAQAAPAVPVAEGGTKIICLFTPCCAMKLHNKCNEIALLQENTFDLLSSSRIEPRHQLIRIPWNYIISCSLESHELTSCKPDKNHSGWWTGLVQSMRHSSAESATLAACRSIQISNLAMSHSQQCDTNISRVLVSYLSLFVCLIHTSRYWWI